MFRYLKSLAPSGLYTGFYWRGFPKHYSIVLHRDSLQLLYVWYRLVNN